MVVTGGRPLGQQQVPVSASLFSARNRTLCFCCIDPLPAVTPGQEWPLGVGTPRPGKGWRPGCRRHSLTFSLSLWADQTRWCPGLQRINLSHCGKITDAAVLALAEGCAGVLMLSWVPCCLRCDASDPAVLGSGRRR